MNFLTTVLQVFFDQNLVWLYRYLLASTKKTLCNFLQNKSRINELFHKYSCKPRFPINNIFVLWPNMDGEVWQNFSASTPKNFHIISWTSSIDFFYTTVVLGFFKHCCIEHCSVAKTEIRALVFFSFNQIKIFACFWFCSFKEAGSLWIQGVWSFVSTSGMIFLDTNKTQEILIKKLANNS